MQPFTSYHRGFTLIELSIVIVIIALVASGVLVGRDMIQAAVVRAQISQIEQYQVAYNAFRLKYSCLPGDCARATALGLGSNGDGNGIADKINTTQCATGDGYHTANYCNTPAPAGTLFQGNSNFGRAISEPNNLWVHLARANLIEGTYREVTGGDTNTTLTDDLAQLSPKFKGTDSYLVIFPYNSHLYIRTGLTAYWNGRQPTFRVATMNGGQALQIMNKLGVNTTLDLNTVMYEDKKAFPQGVHTGTGSGNELFIAASVANWVHSRTCMTNTSPPTIIMNGPCNMIFRFD